jgi:transcriptional regulator with XRE-family HTH domain
MSSKKFNLFNNIYDSYGEAFFNYLKANGLSQKWLAKKIIERGQKMTSLQSQINRWCSGDTVSDEYQIKINNALDISINQLNNGKWKISGENDISNPPRSNKLSSYTIDQLLKEERSRLDIFDIPDTERGREIQSVLDDAVSLVLKLRRLIEKEKNHSD